MDKQRRLTSIEKDYIVKLYAEDKLSSIKIARKLGVSKAAILQLLKVRNIPRRTISEAQRLYSLDEAAFGTLTENSAYWIGFLMADGCVSYRPEKAAPEIQLGLAWKDRNHVKKFGKFLKTCKPTYARYRKDSKSSTLQVTSTQLANDLAKYGVVPRKSHIAKVSSILEFNRHFWRGVVDGDGCINKLKQSGAPRISVVGSKFLMEQFLTYCKSITNTVAKVGRHATIYRVQIANRHALTVLGQLYSNCSIYLLRKYRKASKFLKDGSIVHG